MNVLTPEQREIVARLQSGRLMICEGQGDPNSDGCGGQGYTGAAGQEPCPHCYGAGVMTPELRVALASAPSPEAGAGGDLVSYLHRQWAWSKETFGPALRTKGIVQHITKELREIEAEPHDLAEWVDVIILAMDGFWRHGGKPEGLLPAMQAKQDKNFARTWPDWRTMGEDQAIEHDRSGEGQSPVDPQTDRDAINFALTIDDHYDRLEFLQSWIKGDLSEWPEFASSDAPSTTEADQ